jgi:hypothetical protein
MIDARRLCACGACLFALCVSPAGAFGPQGHLIAGRAAEPALCAPAAMEIARLGAGNDLGEMGLWADRIRSEPAFAHTGPWHYLNIANGALLADYQSPPEGDVLWAIEHFSRRLADRRLRDEARAEALKFLVHFIVDLHQPLHVGLADDRGGNTIGLRFRGEATNLHRLWDTQAIAWADGSVGTYTRVIAELVRVAPGEPSLVPLVWAEESLFLRPQIYAFGRAGREPARSYLDFAAATTRQRLTLAARRLAGTLNAILCD